MRIDINELTSKQTEILREALNDYMNKQNSINNKTYIEDEKWNIACEIVNQLDNIRFVEVAVLL